MNDGMTNDDMPEGWVRAPFSSVTVDPIQRVPGEKENIVYIDIGSVDRITKSVVEPQSMLGTNAPSRARKVIQTGDVLVSTVRPNLNAVALVESQYDGQFASTGFDVLRSPVMDSRWLFYSVRTPEFLDRMSELVQGALYPAVRSKDIRSFVIPIAPLAEQKRIADKLEAVLGRVDACRARLDRVPALLKRFRQSVLAAAMSGKLTEEWRMTNRVNDEWEETQIQHVANVGTGSTPLRSNSAYFAPKGTPWITSAATSKKLVTESEEFVTDAAIKAHRLKKYPVGTLLVAMYGEGKTRGQVTELGIEATINQACAAIVVDESIITKRFVKFSLEANYLEMRELAEGGNQPNLNLSKIKDFPIGLPTLPEQQEIVRRVEDLFAFADRIEARLATAQKTVERLIPATLAKAFRGELVPQDRYDEPASILLERLKQGMSELSQKVRVNFGRTAKIPRALKKNTFMSKSRFDEDVKGKPYLAGLIGGPQYAETAEQLFQRSQLSMVDFYKQLSWEVEKGLIKENGEELEGV